MVQASNAIIKFDDAGNLDLFGHNEVLTRVFRSSDKTLSFRAALSDFDTFAKCCPEMVVIVNELLPAMPQYVADLPEATLGLMDEGKLFLRPDKEGKLLATLVDSERQKIDQLVRLKEVQHIPAVNDMIFSLSFMAITQQLNEIQESIAELRQAQIHDRETPCAVAAQYLQWAAVESCPEKRSSLCSDAHKEALEGFFACHNTVEESARFFLKQPSGTSLGSAFAKQIAPRNWGKTFCAFKNMKFMARNFYRSIKKCAYCAEYAAAASFMQDDKSQVVRDLEMYAENMSRTVLGDRVNHLKQWLSPETAEELPAPLRSLTTKLFGKVDILSYVEMTVSRIERISETPGALFDGPFDDLEIIGNSPEE